MSVISVPKSFPSKLTSEVGLGAACPVSRFCGEDGDVFCGLLFPSLDREDISIGATRIPNRMEVRELHENLKV